MDFIETVTKIVFCCIVIITVGNSYEPVDYGPFRVKLHNIVACKGPKSKDCGVSTVEFWKEKDTILHAKAVVKDKLSKVQVKITGSIRGKVIQRWDMKSACDNLAVKTIFRIMLNATEDCTILKGSYENSIDLEKLAQNFFGGQFIYGNYSFKNVFYTEICNHLCVIIKLSYSPKSI